MDKPQIPSPPLSSVTASADLGGNGVQLDPTANAALEAAIKSARQELKVQSAAERQNEASRIGGLTAGLKRAAKPALMAACALALVGTGWLASYAGTLASRDAIRQMEAETARSQAILAQLSTDLAALKGTLASARDVTQTASTAKTSDQAKLIEKVDRLAAAVQEPGKKIAGLEERLERMESQILASLNGLSAAKPATPAQAEPAAVPAVQPIRNEPVDGWVLREVYKGSALVESRSRGLYEVMPGNVIPGVGRVEAIERRGARWVVVTDKGFIGTYR